MESSKAAAVTTSFLQMSAFIFRPQGKASESVSDPRDNRILIDSSRQCLAPTIAAAQA